MCPCAVLNVQQGQARNYRTSNPKLPPHCWCLNNDTDRKLSWFSSPFMHSYFFLSVLFLQWHFCFHQITSPTNHRHGSWEGWDGCTEKGVWWPPCTDWGELCADDEICTCKILAASIRKMLVASNKTLLSCKKNCYISINPSWDALKIWYNFLWYNFNGFNVLSFSSSSPLEPAIPRVTTRRPVRVWMTPPCRQRQGAWPRWAASSWSSGRRSRVTWLKSMPCTGMLTPGEQSWGGGVTSPLPFKHTHKTQVLQIPLIIPVLNGSLECPF